MMRDRTDADVLLISHDLLAEMLAAHPPAREPRGALSLLHF
ncbi:MAG TPA: hypothetical protein VKW08_01555 [Xanthobacteraceae bacterium]|jgi:hypothetical protein|nr:hypothetical protein [Xanthobacteraceae bacterium]